MGSLHGMRVLRLQVPRSDVRSIDSAQLPSKNAGDAATTASGPACV